jgi:uncharacterized surface protein with fasciclin (FAS1) repeats
MLLVPPVQAQDYDDDDDTGELTEYATIAAIVAEDDNFETLATALEAADLVATFDGEGPFTVFAPTDDAFEALPEGELESLLKKENRDELVELLSYHVVEGNLTTRDIRGMNLPQVRQTLQGRPLTFSSAELGVLVNDAGILNADIDAANGTIHVIDEVLVPPSKQEKY